MTKNIKNCSIDEFKLLIVDISNLIKFREKVESTEKSTATNIINRKDNR